MVWDLEGECNHSSKKAHETGELSNKCKILPVWSAFKDNFSCVFQIESPKKYLSVFSIGSVISVDDIYSSKFYHIYK